MYDHTERVEHGAQARQPIVSTNHATCEPARADCKHEGVHGFTGERCAKRCVHPEMRSPVRSHADDHAERVGTRPRCNWGPPEWWWVAAEADPAPDGIECERHTTDARRSPHESTRRAKQYRCSMAPRCRKEETHKLQASRVGEATIVASAHAFPRHDGQLN